MLITMLKSKIHHARVTSSDLNYIGSITIDSNLMEKAQIYPYEKVFVVNLENGARFETYAITGAPDSKIIELNGAAARLACNGDRLIIMTFCSIEAPPQKDWEPIVLFLDEKNEIK